MNERATAYKIPPQAAASAGAELAVRPKVLRRPAHFNTKTAIEAPVPVLLPLHTATSQAAEKPSPAAFRAWQDDGKFAITLLAIVIVVNLVVSAWLSAISPAKPMVAQVPLVEAPVDAATLLVPVPDNSARDISEQ